MSKIVCISSTNPSYEVNQVIIGKLSTDSNHFMLTDGSIIPLVGNDYEFTVASAWVTSTGESMPVIGTD